LRRHPIHDGRQNSCQSSARDGGRDPGAARQLVQPVLSEEALQLSWTNRLSKANVVATQESVQCFDFGKDANSCVFGKN
jgi:hypothetical protein